MQLWNLMSSDTGNELVSLTVIILEIGKLNRCIMEYNLNTRPCSSLFNSLVLLKEEDMSKLTDLVIEQNATILQLLSVCNISKKVNHCDVPYKNVLVTKIRNLLNNV